MTVFIVAEAIESGVFLIRGCKGEQYFERLVQAKSAALALARTARKMAEDDADLGAVFCQNLHLRTLFALKPEALDDDLANELRAFRAAAPNAEIKHVNSLKAPARFALVEKFCTAKVEAKTNDCA
ncbi:MAG: hypothetical protein ING65_08260 [Rhodocyclaceae bacterium]|nr:hypothetical protein [Rhodocyclaceae bacterium]